MLAGQAALAFTGHVRRAVWRRAVCKTDVLAAVGLAAPLTLGLIVLLWHDVPPQRIGKRTSKDYS